MELKVSTIFTKIWISLCILGGWESGWLAYNIVLHRTTNIIVWVVLLGINTIIAIGCSRIEYKISKRLEENPEILEKQNTTLPDGRKLTFDEYYKKANSQSEEQRKDSEQNNEGQDRKYQISEKTTVCRNCTVLWFFQNQYHI